MSRKPKPPRVRVYAPDFPGTPLKYSISPSSYNLYAQNKILNNICKYLKDIIYLPKECTLIDCLANVGCDSMYFSPLFKKVYALEPRKEEFELLSKNVKMFGDINIISKNKNIISFLNELYDTKNEDLKNMIIYVNLEFIDFNKTPVIGDFDMRYLNSLKLENLLVKIRDSIADHYYVVIKHPRSYPLKKISEIFGYIYGIRSHTVNIVSKEVDGCIITVVYMKPERTSTKPYIRQSGYVNYNYNFDILRKQDEYQNLLYFQGMVIRNEKGERLNHFKLEIEEQMIVPRFIRHDDVVLELGARYGSVSCMINNLLSNQDNHVCVEPDVTVLKALETNREQNGCNFQILNGFISNTPLKLVGLDAWDGYGAHSTHAKPNETIVPSYTLEQVKSKYKLQFNVFVADCEGCLEKFFAENPNFYDEIRLFIFERDYPKGPTTPNGCDYKKIENELLKRGFKAIVSGHQNVYEREILSKTKTKQFTRTNKTNVKNIRKKINPQTRSRNPKS